MLPLLLTYAALFPVLLYVYSDASRQRFYPWMKLILGVCFVAIASVSFPADRSLTARILLTAGFVSAAAGDVFLGFARVRDRFREWETVAGTFCFLLAHVLLYSGFSFFYSPAVADFFLPIASVATVVLLTESVRRSMGKLRFLACFYAYFIGLLAAKGITAIARYGCSRATLLVLLGGILILASDILLLFINYRGLNQKPAFYLHLFSYYVGVLLLSCSLVFI